MTETRRQEEELKSLAMLAELSEGLFSKNNTETTESKKAKLEAFVKAMDGLTERKIGTTEIKKEQLTQFLLELLKKEKEEAEKRAERIATTGAPVEVATSLSDTLTAIEHRTIPKSSSLNDVLTAVRNKLTILQATPAAAAITTPAVALTANEVITGIVSGKNARSVQESNIRTALKDAIDTLLEPEAPLETLTPVELNELNKSLTSERLNVILALPEAEKVEKLKALAEILRRASATNEAETLTTTLVDNLDRVLSAAMTQFTTAATTAETKNLTELLSLTTEVLSTNVGGQLPGTTTPWTGLANNLAKQLRNILSTPNLSAANLTMLAPSTIELLKIQPPLTEATQLAADLVNRLSVVLTTPPVPPAALTVENLAKLTSLATEALNTDVVKRLPVVAPATTTPAAILTTALINKLPADLTGGVAITVPTGTLAATAPAPILPPLPARAPAAPAVTAGDLIKLAPSVIELLKAQPTPAPGNAQRLAANLVAKLDGALTAAVTQLTTPAPAAPAGAPTTPALTVEDLAKLTSLATEALSTDVVKGLLPVPASREELKAKLDKIATEKEKRKEESVTKIAALSGALSSGGQPKALAKLLVLDDSQIGSVIEQVSEKENMQSKLKKQTEGILVKVLDRLPQYDLLESDSLRKTIISSLTEMNVNEENEKILERLSEEERKILGIVLANDQNDIVGSVLDKELKKVVDKKTINIVDDIIESTIKIGKIQEVRSELRKQISIYKNGAVRLKERKLSLLSKAIDIKMTKIKELSKAETSTAVVLSNRVARLVLLQKEIEKQQEQRLQPKEPRIIEYLKEIRGDLKEKSQSKNKLTEGTKEFIDKLEKTNTETISASYSDIKSAGEKSKEDVGDFLRGTPNIGISFDVSCWNDGYLDDIISGNFVEEGRSSGEKKTEGEIVLKPQKDCITDREFEENGNFFSIVIEEGTEISKIPDIIQEIKKGNLEYLIGEGKVGIRYFRDKETKMCGNNNKKTFLEGLKKLNLYNRLRKTMFEKAKEQQEGNTISV
ncbi:MAG: hypothetical protein LBG48_01370 [Rickettsiales bacterium]|jgi:hypothetical protein|nr:hypothetical protein [Rickettsiales bacterium]